MIRGFSDKFLLIKLSIRTPWEDVNDELKVNCLFADNTNNNWSVKTAESVFRYLLYDEKQEIQAKYFKVSQPAISKRFALGNMKAMDAFIKRYEKIIDHQVNLPICSKHFCCLIPKCQEQSREWESVQREAFLCNPNNAKGAGVSTPAPQTHPKTKI